MFRTLNVAKLPIIFLKNNAFSCKTKCNISSASFIILHHGMSRSPLKYANERTSVSTCLHVTRFYSQNSDKENETNKDIPVMKPVPVGKRLMVIAGIIGIWGAIYYFATRKKEEKRLVERDQQISKVDIGKEDFNLIDHDGKPVSKKDFEGKWLLLYFGFTHCPDICPEELERMAEIVDIIDLDKSVPDILPLFLTVDPERDTPPIVKRYVKEFHKKFVGLTGTKEDIKDAAKAFRVYFSAGPKDQDDDYIIDHTIVMYLMSPKGQFVDYYGSRSTARQDVVESIKKNMKNYHKLHGNL